MSKKNSSKNSVVNFLEELISEHCGGSMAKFADKFAECSRSQVSRVMLGQQKLSMELRDRIAGKLGVDGEKLLLAWKETYEGGSLYVPIAQCLLSKSAHSSKKLLSNQVAEVPSGFFSSSVYAVRAKNTKGIQSVTIEPDDLLLLDTTVRDFKKNLDFLDGKMAAIQLSGEESFVQLAELSVQATNKGVVIHALQEAKQEIEKNTAPQMAGDREYRRIKLRSNSKKGKETTTVKSERDDHGDQKTVREGQTIQVQFKQIVGVVVLLMRGV